MKLVIPNALPRRGSQPSVIDAATNREDVHRRTDQSQVIQRAERL
jgi:hypothetical protein